MKNKFTYIKSLILISPMNFAFICILLIIEIGILSFAVLSLVPLVDFIIDPTLTNKSRITDVVINYLGYLKIDPSFLIFAFFFVFFQLFKALITIFINYSILKFKYDVLRKINNDTLNLILNSNWNFFSEIDYGYLTNTFVKEINNIGHTVGQLARMFASFTQFFIYLSIPLLINLNLTLSIIILIGIVIIPVLKFSGPLSYKLGKENTNTANYMMSSLSEILKSLKFIFINSRTKLFITDFINKFDLHVNATLKSQILATTVNAFFQPLGILIIIIVFAFFMSKGIILSEVAAIFYSLISIVSATNTLLGINININNLIPSIDQLNDILNKSSQFQKKNGSIKFNKLNHKIEFKDVNFSYKNKNRIIHNLNIEIKKNSITSIIGKSGSGKSTIMDLLTGLLEISDGKIFIDQINLKDIDLSTFRDKIGYVTQDTTLFNTSILNNLRYVSSNQYSEDQIWESLKFANLSEFVESLPDKLNTNIGEQGIQFSGGQRQRLSLARAFLKKPNILILDEATSSLDSISEQEIQKTILNFKNEGTTTIIIAHRLSTIKTSDFIFVMESGKIIEKGDYQKLTSMKNSKFNIMLRSQIIN
jgi:ABC-type multidrug transport system fused ATPase/permease subunit